MNKTLDDETNATNIINKVEEKDSRNTGLSNDQSIQNMTNDNFVPTSKDSPQYSTPNDCSKALLSEKSEMFSCHQDAINDLSQPLLNTQEHSDAFAYGYSFNSKQMNMAPAFFNLRIICDCLGKAIRKHIDFSQTYNGKELVSANWFLDSLYEAKKQAKLEKKLLKQELAQITGKDLEESATSNVTDITSFSYKFKDELKINSSKRIQDDSDDDLERVENTAQ